MNETAIALMKQAQDLHFSKRFDEAVQLYQRVVTEFSDSAEAKAAQRQLDNLRPTVDQSMGRAGLPARHSTSEPSVSQPSAVSPSPAVAPARTRSRLLVVIGSIGAIAVFSIVLVVRSHGCSGDKVVDCWKAGYAECVKQCDKNNSLACYRTAMILSNGSRTDPSGTPVAQDRYRGLEYLEKGCTLGFRHACNDKALWYFRGWGVNADQNHATEILDPSCSNGDADACHGLVYIAESLGHDPSVARGRLLELWKKECERNQDNEPDEFGDLETYDDEAGKERISQGRALPCWGVAQSGWVPVDEALKYARMACDRQPGRGEMCKSPDDLLKEVTKRRADADKSSRRNQR